MLLSGSNEKQVKIQMMTSQEVKAKVLQWKLQSEMT